MCSCVSLVEAVGGLSVGLKCLCGMGLQVASMLPLPLPTLAVSVWAWVPVLVLPTLRFYLWKKLKINLYLSGLGLERLRLVHSMRSAWEEVRRTRLRSPVSLSSRYTFHTHSRSLSDASGLDS